MRKLLSIVALAALLTGCSPYTLVNSEVYNNANLAAYKTFHIVTPDEGEMVPGMQMVTYYNIAAAIREQMVERGFIENPESPLLINIGITIHHEIATEPLDMLYPPYGPNYAPYPGPPPYPGYAPFFMYPRSYYFTPPYYPTNAQVITGIYKEGVLTMDMVNMDTKVPLYSSSVATIIQTGETGYRNLEGIAEAVQTLFSKFPVPLLPQYRKK